MDDDGELGCADPGATVCRFSSAHAAVSAAESTRPLSRAAALCCQNKARPIAESQARALPARPRPLAENGFHMEGARAQVRRGRFLARVSMLCKSQEGSCVRVLPVRHTVL